MSLNAASLVSFSVAVSVPSPTPKRCSTEPTPSGNVDIGNTGPLATMK